MGHFYLSSVFFFNDPATTEIYTLSLHDALPIYAGYTQSDISTLRHAHIDWQTGIITRPRHKTKGKQVHKLWPITDRKSTRLNSSHSQISYAVFCLKKKKKLSRSRQNQTTYTPPQ